MKLKSHYLIGSTAITSVLLALTIIGTSFSLQWDSKINEVLGIDNVVVKTDENDTYDTNYYPSEYGDINSTNQAKLLADSKEQCYNEVGEGATLMRNENNALPLTSSERKISIFGNNAKDFVYLPSGGGEGNSVSADNMITFYDAFTTAGFEINPTLREAYDNSGVERTYDAVDINSENIGEAPLSIYTDSVKSSFSSYNDAAIIVISRESGEGADMWMNDYENISKLALHQNERDMIEMITSSGQFEKTIVIINTTNQLELDWLEEYDIDACLWVGSTGQWGCSAIPDLLTGTINPSGSLVDTWAADSLSAPACVNSCTNTPQYTNLDTIAQTVKDSQSSYAYITTYVEGIYVGYKYYETRYEDSILNQGNATSSKGSIRGSWDYAAEMVYSFGHGLSYTTFSQTLDSVVDNGDGTMTATVTVTNTGDVAGKKTVMLYAQTPYGDYEKENQVEKSSIAVVQFDKTETLQPSESETLELVVDKYLLASYDENNAKTYILSEGDYYLSIGDSVHSALNNILAAKGASGLIDEAGNSVTGDSSLTYKWTEEFDNTTYATSKYTGNAVTNQFDDCDLNYFYEEDVVTYLSRNDWDSTYPTSQTAVAATDEMIQLLKGDIYETPSDAKSLSEFEIGINKNISLIQLKDLDYDDEKWEDYLSQYTLDELGAITAEASGTKPIEKYLVPNVRFVDGPMGLCGKMPYDSETCTTFPSMPILAGSCNKDLITRRGELMGEQGLYSGYNVVNGPGLNLHRTPFNGRSCIYFSEDSNLTYLIAPLENAGMTSKGVTTAVKHFVGNDQEFARQGVSTFFSEQGMRETSLRAFESSLNATENTYGSMMAFNRIGCVSDNNASNVKTIARDEWGFKGFFQTDAAQHYSIYFVTELASGTSLFSTDTTGRGGKAIVEYIEENDDGYLLEILRETVHNIHYAFVHNNAMNGISPNTVITTTTPWWQYTEYGIIAFFSILTAAGLALTIVSDIQNRRKNILTNDTKVQGE